jgi:hypothetical protein
VLLAAAIRRPEPPIWHPHDTVTDTFMRRRRWWGWQRREMTPDELQAHVEQRQAAWLGEADIRQTTIITSPC